MDRYNLEILQTLQSDARISAQALAERVSLSPNACLQRVRKLEQAGYIQRYRTRLDINRIAVSVTAIAEITLRDQSILSFRGFEKAIRNVPQVTACTRVSAHYDYLVWLICTDIYEYHQIADALLQGDLLPEDAGIAAINGHIVMDESKPFSGFPLGNIVKLSP